MITDIQILLALMVALTANFSDWLRPPTLYLNIDSTSVELFLKLFFSIRYE